MDHQNPSQISVRPVHNIEQQINSLNKSVFDLEHHLATLQRESQVLRQYIRPLRRKRSLYRFILRLRLPGERFDLWPIGVMCCGPLIVGAAFFIVSHLLIRSSTFSAIAFCLSALATGITLPLLLYVPRKNVVEAWLRTCEVSLNGYQDTHLTLSKEIACVARELRSHRAKRDALATSVQYQRELLLHRHWKEMRGIQWEQYLVEVCKALGYSVNTTSTSGDQGVDLVIQRGARRIAIQAKGYFDSVGNAAVQQVVAGTKVYGCDHCAVITNSRFTTAAEQLAAVNDCVLISEDNFQDFVLGSFPL